MSFGRLERSQSAAPMSDINMTPLIDVMLVLLVIFIITAPLLVSSVQLDLPKANGTSAPNAPQFVELSIDPKGQVFVNDRLLDNADLGRVLNCLLMAEVNILFSYPMLSRPRGKALLVLHVDDNECASVVLQGEGYEIMTQGDLSR